MSKTMTEAKHWKPLLAVITDETTGAIIRTTELRTAEEAEKFMHTAHWLEMGITRMEFLSTHSIEMQEAKTMTKAMLIAFWTYGLSMLWYARLLAKGGHHA